MRVRLPQSVLVVLSVALLAPAALAHPSTPAHRVARAPHKSAATAVRPPIDPAAKARKAYARRGAVPAVNPAKRDEETRLTVEVRKRAQNPRAPRPTAVTKLRPQPFEPGHLHAANGDPPLADTPGPPPTELRHNRKIHLAPAAAEPAESDTDAAPRKATVQDFLDAPATPPNDPAAAAAPLVAVAPDAPAVIHSASIVVERKPAPFPVAKVPVRVRAPLMVPVRYSARGHLTLPPAMKGSREILLHQNEMADRDGLVRVRDDDDLKRLRASRQLVALPVSPALEVDERLPVDRRYCRPWTAQFLAAMARAHYARFHAPLQVNSAVRTILFQERLRSKNGNAAPAEGDSASPHLTGQAVDLAKHGLSMTEIAWMRGYLLPLVQRGKVDVEEEFQQSCFHISVYKSYLPQPAPKRQIAPRRPPANALAAAIH